MQRHNYDDEIWMKIKKSQLKMLRKGWENVISHNELGVRERQAQTPIDRRTKKRSS